MKTTNFLKIALALAASSALADTVLFDVFVPGHTDKVYVDGVDMGGFGTQRAMKTSVASVGNYRYTIRVEHNGAAIDRVVSFQGNEGRITVRFASEEFQGSQIAALILAYKNTYQAPDPKRVPQARARLHSAMNVMDAMISRSDSAEHWRHRFSWTTLAEELQSNAPNASKLDRALRNMFTNEPGMEYPQVAALQEAVAEYRDAALFAAHPNLGAEYARTIAALAAVAPKYEAEQKAEQRIALGKHLSFLERGKLAPGLVQTLHARYNGRANNIAQFNVSMVEKYAVKPVNETKSGNYLILGNPTSGTSTVNGQTYLRFIPNERQAEIEVGMTGHMLAHSRSTGGAKGVTVTVNGTTQNYVQVSKRIVVNGLSKDGLVLHPATAQVQPIPGGTTAQVHSHANAMMPRLPRGLQFVRNLKERIGYQKALEQMPAGQAEGRRIAAGELASAANTQQVEMPEQMKNVAGQFENLAKEFIEVVQKRRGVFPKHQWLSTDSRWLYMKHVRRNGHELSALGEAPPLRNQNTQIAVRVHESDIMNQVNGQLSGYEMTDGDVQWFGRNIMNYVPALLRLGTHQARWKMQFVDDTPLALDFEDDSRVVATLRFQSLNVEAHGASPARSLSVPFGMRGVYRLQKKGTPMLERLEEVQIVPLDGESQWSEADQALLSEFMLPRAKSLFKEEIYFDGMTPVRGGIFEPLTKLIVRELRTENNWLLVGLDFDGDLLDIIKSTPSGLGGDDKAIPTTPGK